MWRGFVNSPKVHAQTEKVSWDFMNFCTLKKIKCEDNSQNERLYLKIVYLIKVQCPECLFKEFQNKRTKKKMGKRIQMDISLKMCGWTEAFENTLSSTDHRTQ